MHECFVSYSHKDMQIATAIQSILEQKGIRCWIDFRDAIPGIDYASSIVRAIKSSQFFILVLSENSSKSPHVLNEINSAVNASVTIIPFKVDEGELDDSMEYYLGKTHWLDALTPPLENHIVQLASTIGAQLSKTENRNDVCKQTVTYNQNSKLSNLNECRMVKFEELLNLGYTAKSISLQLVENDYINCNGIGLENEGTAQQWEEFLQNNSETFQYLINADNKIVGDWSIVALNEDHFEKAKRGELLEMDIDINTTEMIN